MNAYDVLAEEYYDVDLHKTSRNFDAISVSVAMSMRNQLPSQGLVLEVGAGRGRCTEFLGVASDRIVQLDSSGCMLALKKREPCLLKVQHVAESLPFVDEQFSVVAGFLCDPYLGLNFLSEAYRVLKSGGLLVCTAPNEKWGQALRETSDYGIDSARFVTREGAVVTVPSFLLADARIAEMLGHVGFDYDSIVVKSYPLPVGTVPVSEDVVRPAKKLNCDPYELPLLSWFSATK